MLHQLEFYIFIVSRGPILESQSMCAIFQKTSKKKKAKIIIIIIIKKGKIFENMGEHVQNLEIFWKRVGDCVWLSHAINCEKRPWSKST